MTRELPSAADAAERSSGTCARHVPPSMSMRLPSGLPSTMRLSSARQSSRQRHRFLRGEWQERAQRRRMQYDLPS